MLEIGSLVDGKYKILNKIGQGGMSVVYLAMNEKANKQWAVKEVRKDGMKDFEVVRQGLVVETDLLKRLSHPNLPSIIDVIEEQDTLLIVMDYIEGNPLSKALEEYGPQNQEQVIAWAKQLCDVLGYLHTREPAIIYRDMKPANIMLKPEGKVTLIDFGTAREFKEKNLEDTTCLGTVGYAAPEQFGGQGQTDARTDIYCLGATLYHLVTGCSPCEPPYQIQPIRQINPSLSSGLEKIITKCTQPNPEQRYQTCAELMYALEHYEEIDDLHRKKQKKKLVSFLTASALTVALMIVAIGTSVMASKTKTNSYNEIIDLAKKKASTEEKIATYEDAIEVKKEEGTAYLGLIDTYKEDSYYSKEEEANIVSHLKNNKNMILARNRVEYANICFQMGKMYWYYYNTESANVSTEDMDKNRVLRMKAAISWFADALEYGGEEFVYYNMATIYKEIGIFYRDIDLMVTEASDKGMYGEYFVKLGELLGVLEQNQEESEIVKLEVYQLGTYSLMKYRRNFKADGITKEAMMGFYERLLLQLKSTDTTTDKTSAMKETTVELLEGAKQELEVVYQNN